MTGKDIISVETFFRRHWPNSSKSYTGFALGKAAIAVYREKHSEDPPRKQTTDGRNFRAQYTFGWLNDNFLAILAKAKDNHERTTRRKNRAGRRASAAGAA